MNKYQKWIIPVLTGTLLVAGCQKEVVKPKQTAIKMVMPKEEKQIRPNGVYYEIFVRSFADSNGDGIGDIKGMTEKLDYLKDLGVEGVWLMPIMPSPSYHGYDVSNYEAVNPDYGTIQDMKTFVQEAHKRNINVIIDMVMNHTSTQNPWFQKALAGDPHYRNYYVWAKPDTFLGKRGEWGQQIWQGSGKNTYEGIFDKSMPDLNYDNPDVRKEMIKAGTFWMKDVGVDGFRLDAAKYLYSSFETSDNHQKNIEFWTEFRTAMEKINPIVMMVGEIWDSPAVIGPYLKGLSSGFNFDLSTQIINTVKEGYDSGIAASLTRTLDFYKKQNPSFLDSTFLTNHDMDRIMSQVGGNENMAKIAASILFTLPGNPYIYYGEETGMEGAKPDEEIRQPFTWDVKQSKEETTWEPNNQDRSKVAVSAQMDDKNSMYSHYKELITLRRSSEALIKGNLEELPYDINGIVGFKRETDKESLLIFHNVSQKPITLKIKEKEYSKLYYASFKITSLKTIKLPAYSTVILTK